MPVNKVPVGTVLRLELQIGVDANGNPIYRNRSLNNVKPAALDQDLYDVAAALAGLQEYSLNSVVRIDRAQIVQV
jgi:hypothetical protein